MNILLLLSHFSRVQLCATPYTAGHQAPPSLGFSRQEHWSGLPFLQCVKVKSLGFVQPSATPWTAAHPAPLSMAFSRQGILEWVAILSPGIFPTQDRTPVFPILQEDSLLSEPPGKPKETLLQRGLLLLLLSHFSPVRLSTTP